MTILRSKFGRSARCWNDQDIDCSNETMMSIFFETNWKVTAHELPTARVQSWLVLCWAKLSKGEKLSSPGWVEVECSTGPSTLERKYYQLYTFLQLEQPLFHQTARFHRAESTNVLGISHTESIQSTFTCSSNFTVADRPCSSAGWRLSPFPLGVPSYRESHKVMIKQCHTFYQFLQLNCWENLKEHCSRIYGASLRVSTAETRKN